MHILTLQVRISMDPNWPPSLGKIESLQELEAREAWQRRKLRSRRGYCSLAVVRPSLCTPSRKISSLTQKRRFPPPDPGHVREAEVHLAFAKRRTPQSPGSTQLGVTAGDGGAKLFPETAMSHSGDEHANPSSETRKSHININNDNRFI